MLRHSPSSKVMKCRNIGCDNEVANEHFEKCDKCLAMAARPCPPAPSFRGLESGPGRRYADGHFDRFHAPTEILQTAHKMEADGVAQRNPQLFAAICRKVAAVKGKDAMFPHVDYQKTGHPCLTREDYSSDLG